MGGGGSGGGYYRAYYKHTYINIRKHFLKNTDGVLLIVCLQELFRRMAGEQKGWPCKRAKEEIDVKHLKWKSQKYACYSEI